MPDGTTGIIVGAWDWTKGLIIALLGILGWNWKRMDKRVENLEKNTVSAEIFNKTILSLRDDFKNHADRVEKGITRTHERIDKMLEKK